MSSRNRAAGSPIARRMRSREVGPPPDVVDDLVRERVEEHPVDGEIAPRGVELRRAERHRFGPSAVDVRPVAPEGGDLHLDARSVRAEHADHAERDADGDRPAPEEGDDLLGRRAGGHVVIGGGQPQHQVADAAPRPERPEARALELADDLRRELAGPIRLRHRRTLRIGCAGRLGTSLDGADRDLSPSVPAHVPGLDVGEEVRIEFPARLQGDHRSRGEVADQVLDQLPDLVRAFFILPIRGVEEDDHRLVVDRLERARPAVRVDRQDARPILVAERRHVAVDQGDILPLLLDEDRPRRPPAQRLQAERPGPREEVDHDQVLDIGPQDVEQRLAHQVAGGPGAAPLRSVEFMAATLARDDAHGPTLPPSVRPLPETETVGSTLHLTNPGGNGSCSRVAADELGLTRLGPSAILRRSLESTSESDSRRRPLRDVVEAAEAVLSPPGRSRFRDEVGLAVSPRQDEGPGQP